MQSNVAIHGYDNAPSPPGYPLVGVLPMVWQNPLQFLVTSRKYGEVVRLRMGPRSFYLVHHPDHVKRVLQDKMSLYPKSKFFLTKIRSLLGESVGALGGDIWSQRRRLLQPAFRPKLVAGMTTAIADATQTMLDSWRVSAKQGTAVEVQSEMLKLSNRIIIKTIFGVDPDTEASLFKCFDVVRSHINNRLFGLVDIPESFPTPANRRYLQARKTLDSFIFGVIERRRRSPSSEDATDLLGMLISVRDEETGEGISDQQLRDEMIAMFLAGVETTGIPMTWVWYFLSMHPEVARQLDAELETVLGGRTPTYEDLSKLTYTRMVIDETMRVYPPGWMWFRAPTEDDEFDGFRIPAGEPVLLCPYATHRHPDFWENPESFDPERFAPQLAAKHHPFAYFPFSNGPRVCIARGLSIIEMQMVVAMIAQNFRLHRVPGYAVVPQPLATLIPKNGLPMLLREKKRS